jgi:hypothetical protein
MLRTANVVFAEYTLFGIVKAHCAYLGSGRSTQLTRDQDGCVARQEHNGIPGERFSFTHTFTRHHALTALIVIGMKQLYTMILKDRCNGIRQAHTGTKAFLRLRKVAAVITATIQPNGKQVLIQIG